MRGQNEHIQLKAIESAKSKPESNQIQIKAEIKPNQAEAEIKPNPTKSNPNQSRNQAKSKQNLSE